MNEEVITASDNEQPFHRSPNVVPPTSFVPPGLVPAQRLREGVPAPALAG